MDARTLCLGILKEQPASGYDIKKAVEEGPFQHFFGISFGSIYPTLSRLAADGDIETVEANSTGGHPTKRRFTMTEKGRAEFRSQLAAFDTRDKLRSEFVLALFFFGELEVHERIEILDKRIAHLNADLTHLDEKRSEFITSQCEEEGHHALLGYATSIRSAEVNYLLTYRDQLAAQTPNIYELETV